jgi:hypothetical protein
MPDHAQIVDSPDEQGFYARGRFYPYVMGADDSASGDNGDAGAGGDGGDGGDADNTDQNGTDDGSSDGKKFTQEEVNALIAKEVAKGTRGKIDPKQLGFDSQKELQEFLDAQKAKNDADKTEAEKQMEEALEAAKKEATDGILSTANARVLKAEFRISALEAGIPKDRLEDAFALAQLHEDWAPEVSDTGDVTGITDEFFESLKEAKPYLFAEENEDGAGDIGAGAGGGKDSKNRAADLASKYPVVAQLQRASGSKTP